MTDEQIRIEVAKRDGWISHTVAGKPFEIRYAGTTLAWKSDDDPLKEETCPYGINPRRRMDVPVYWEPLPNYPTSRDAIIASVLRLPDEVLKKLAIALIEHVMPAANKDLWVRLLTAPARDICLAYLEATTPQNRAITNLTHYEETAR